LQLLDALAHLAQLLLGIALPRRRSRKAERDAGREGGEGAASEFNLMICQGISL
jgi:hypothetical protein